MLDSYKLSVRICCLIHIVDKIEPLVSLSSDFGLNLIELFAKVVINMFNFQANLKRRVG